MYYGNVLYQKIAYRIQIPDMCEVVYFILLAGYAAMEHVRWKMSALFYIIVLLNLKKMYLTRIMLDIQKNTLQCIFNAQLGDASSILYNKNLTYCLFFFAILVLPFF